MHQRDVARPGVGSDPARSRYHRRERRAKLDERVRWQRWERVQRRNDRADTAGYEQRSERRGSETGSGIHVLGTGRMDSSPNRHRMPPDGSPMLARILGIIHWGVDRWRQEDD